VELPNQPQSILQTIPDPDTVRAWLAECIREAALLRSLLRVAERKASYERTTAERRKELALCK
jgi:hypothetical protein